MPKLIGAIVRAFAQTRGETLDAVALSIAAYLDSDDNPSVATANGSPVAYSNHTA